LPKPLAASVFDLIARISAATSVRDVWSIYTNAAEQCGLEFGIAAFLPDDKSVGETTFANNMPGHWLENYVQESYQEYDPLMRRNHVELQPFEWSMDDYGVHDLIANQINWRDDNRAAGIDRGLTIPDRHDGHLKVITLCGRAGSLDIDDRRALHFAGLEALLRMHELGLEGQQERIAPLSPRERECLHWLLAGKSDWEIGQILSISEKTVNTHIERVKHKLGVATRAQAIVSALRHRLINP
jgi:LuxR family quorum sensing-dependent transcriptional regulator